MCATRRIAIGLMSGTSADGVDAAACAVTGRGAQMRARLLHFVEMAFPRDLRRDLLAVMAPAAIRTEMLCRLDVRVGQAFARAAGRLMKAARLTPARVAVIGSHGQTICHLHAEGATLQIGRAAVIAAETGCRVVSDFRSSDMAVGGQGAPLVPWTDWLLLRDRRRTRAVQNIGGIANVTYLPAGGRTDEVIAFDTGPGNMVLDELAGRLSNGRLGFDRNGRLALAGRTCETILREWLRHPFFDRRPPRSAGREEFGRTFVTGALRRHAHRKLSLPDWLATATAFTVESIARSYERYLPSAAGRPVLDEMILCGGGANNSTLRRGLARRLPCVMVRTMNEVGIPARAKEAMSFALLACARLDVVPANLPQVTGARRPVILGQLTERPPQ